MSRLQCGGERGDYCHNDADLSLLSPIVCTISVYIKTSVILCHHLSLLVINPKRVLLTYYYQNLAMSIPIVTATEVAELMRDMEVGIVKLTLKE